MKDATDLGSDALNQVDRLVAELRAVEHWDADYWRKGDPEVYEIVAFVTRQKRRTEILSQLVNLFTRVAI
jgi:hypothetical protein